jgi:hypothetical protein
VVRAFAAAYCKTDWWTIGGRLYLTDLRLVHVPSVIDVWLRAKPWVAAISDIRDIAGEPRKGLGAGIRRRLRIELSDGTVGLFVVNHLNDLIPTLRRDLGLRPTA